MVKKRPFTAETRRRGGMPGAAAGGRRRSQESGYALLLVFLMAAVIAISLYSEVPRVAFQSQRHKEQLLMERGLQYQRAIQVYYQTTKTYPPNLDAIVTYQMRHFLRHKYIDPMTGKDEWRLIHIQGMVLTDSLVTQPTTTTKPATTESNYVGVYNGLGQSDVGAPSERPQDHRRPSEGGGSGGDQLMPLMPGAPIDPSMPPPPGSPSPTDQPAAGTTTDNPANQANPVSGNPTQGTPGGQPGAPGMPAVGTQLPAPGGTGQPGPGLPGLPGQAGNPALGMINQLLTNPNPQAGQIIQQQGGASAAPGTTIGPALAGVASKSEQEGVMVFNDQTFYKKWEFVFDPTKVPAIATGTAPSGSTSVNQMGSPSGPGAPGMGGGTGMMGALGQAGAGGAGTMGGLGQTGAMGAGMPTGAGVQGNGGATGTPNNSAGMQTAGGGSSGMPPGFRMGRP